MIVTNQEQINYWITSANEDLKVAESLFSNKHFAYCLYIGHLCLEKTLKAHYVKTQNKIPPKTHDLIYLSRFAAIEFNDENLLFLDKVNSFLLEARYPDYKRSFYEICTHDFAEANFSQIKELMKWLLSLI